MSTVWPRLWRPRAASTTKRSAPPGVISTSSMKTRVMKSPMPKSGWRNAIRRGLFGIVRRVHVVYWLAWECWGHCEYLFVLRMGLLSTTPPWSRWMTREYFLTDQSPSVSSHQVSDSFPNSVLPLYLLNSWSSTVNGHAYWAQRDK